MIFLREFGNRQIGLALLLLLALPITLGATVSCQQANAQVEEPWFAKGKELYVDQCATCHGDQGQGVEGAYENTLEGDLSLRRLKDYIVKTMPEDDPEMCVGEDAELVTRYMMKAFYTREAQMRLKPPGIAFSRLTVDQYQNAVADLMRPFLGAVWIGDNFGLKGQYFPTRSHGKDRAFERTDDLINFDFGDGTPDAEKLKDKEQFSIDWSGSLIAPDSGTYELILVTQNGVQFFFNGQSWNSSPLIDNKVTNGETEHRATVKLRAGRAYPLHIQFFKYKEDSASIAFEWVRPNRPRELVGKKHLTPQWAPPAVMLQTDFPPDDSSVGYERGTSVSQQWDRATTLAAVEVLEFVDRKYNDLTGYSDKIRKKERKDELDDSAKAAAEATRTRAFCEKFVRQAFRRDLTEAEKATFIERPFATEDLARNAMRRIVLMTLKSPQFLYVSQSPSRENANAQFSAAEKMAIGFWDSIPDKDLLNAAAAGKLDDDKTLHTQAWRMLGDARTRVKLRQFFHHWLELDRATDATKDLEAYPGFDDKILGSLAESLDLAIEEIVWSEESDFRQLLASDKMFVDDRIADFYGIDKPDNDTFEKKSFEPELRAGVLTHPYLMTGLAYHKNTSPIHRGVFVAKSLLGRSLKPPPIDVEPLDEAFDPTLTTRERVVHQTKEIACQGCHSVINPLGFSFENFDAVGRFRDTEKKQKIDASAEYETPDGEVLKFNGAKDLAKYLIENDDAHRNFIEQLFRHFAKQPLAAYGPDKIDDLLTKFQRNQFNVRQLLVDMSVVVARHELDAAKQQENENE
ncbi:DUF1592 domain-containing protein [Mariniblastus fucicola]|uniref:PA14 domain protein n=1 Tax=Mariniblastus fucicola TaxID=980251 RepID=A0A5B9P8L0_9BACT|nr:DUF1592 domain-containing protein [Mariniblastus fucicola]QEG23067.1 PA14 domain protein [Mariniblastus fucicola]